MSDSKRDITRIEDLGEYLHELDDEEGDYLPEIPDDSAPPAFMEETRISEDPFSLNEESSTSFESDVTDDDDEISFSSEETFNPSENFESEGFGENSDFSSESTFDSGSNFESSTDFSASEPFEDPDVENTEFGYEVEEKEDDAQDSEAIEAIDDTNLFSAQPDEDTTQKTPLPQVEESHTFQAPENFEDLKKFAESSNFSGMASEGNPSFSVLLKEIKFLEDAQDILTLLKELKLTVDSDEVLINRLSRGEFLIPRVSEFAATLLAHKLRRFDIDILVGLSDEIHPPKHSEVSETGLVSKQSLYQNQSHHFQFDEVNLDISQIIVSATPTLDGYQVLKYVGVASEHKMLEGHLVEDENSVEISSHYHELAHKLKAHALKNQANAVVGLSYQLTPLPSHYGTSSTRYRLTCTGNLVWINRI